MTGIDEIRYCGLILTERCNLRCRYCYQNARSGRAMSWETARSAVDRFLASGSEELEFLFTGGEPLLEFPLLRRIVAYIEERAGAGRRITLRISTNGTLLDAEKLSFLAAHQIETQISFDGVRDAQDLRGAGTFDVLDNVLRGLKGRHPGQFRRRLRVAMTLVPETVPRLAESVEYLIGAGVPQIVMTPAMNGDRTWRPERIEELDEQFGRIFDLGIAEYERTGQVPVAVFRGRRANEECGEGGGPMCAVVRGRSIAVDAGGESYGCTSFVPSYQTFGGGLLAASLEPLRIGPIDSPGFEEKRREYVERIACARIFHAKEEKYSSYGRCGDCPYLTQCLVCPVSIGHISGSDDPDRIPDFACAYHRTALQYRAAFPAQPGLRELLEPPPGLLTEMRRWRSIAARLEVRGGISADATVQGGAKGAEGREAQSYSQLRRRK